MNRIMAVLFFFTCCCSTSQAAPIIGSEGTVKPKMIAFCATKDAYDKWVQASVVKDEDGMKELLFSFQCAFANQGDRVLVLDKGWAVIKIRIKSGTWKGKAGWTAIEFIE